MKFTTIVDRLKIIILFLTCSGLLISCTSSQPTISASSTPKLYSSPSQLPTRSATPDLPYPSAHIETPNSPYPSDYITTPNSPYPSNASNTIVPPTLTSTPSPTIPAPVSTKSEMFPTTVSSTLDCSMINDTFSQCFDDVLDITFEIPTQGGVITTSLTNHNADPNITNQSIAMGHIYTYEFEHYPSSNLFKHLNATGWSNDYAIPRGGGIRSKFTDCSRANICEEIAPNVLLTLNFPNATHLCDPGPGRMTYPAHGAITVYFPENSQINVFYFTGPTIIESLNDDLVSTLVNLDPYERNCSEETIQQFNDKLDKILMDIEQGTLDETSTQNIELLYHIAESITFVEQP